jgi:hypothetical protein
LLFLPRHRFLIISVSSAQSARKHTVRLFDLVKNCWMKETGLGYRSVAKNRATTLRGIFEEVV